MANMSRRVREDQMGNTHMARLRVTSDVGQCLQNGNYVPAHKPTEIDVYEYQVPNVIEQLRLDDEKDMIDKATAEYKVRIQAEKDKCDTEDEKAMVERHTGLSVQGVLHSMFKGAVIHPLLKVERLTVCGSKQCGVEYYADVLDKSAKCAKCGTAGSPKRLPPPKAVEQYNQNNEMIQQILAAVVPEVIKAIKGDDTQSSKKAK